MPDRDELEHLLDDLVRGDRYAFLRLSRMVTGSLAAMRAYDFRDEWPDLVQEVVSAVAAAYADGRLRDAAALSGFVRSVTRNKLSDRLKREIRLRGEERIVWEAMTLDDAGPVAFPERHSAMDVRRALESLPEKKGIALVRVYVEGKTYEEVAAETGIPLGTLKRYLREGLAELRERLRE